MSCRHKLQIPLTNGARQCADCGALLAGMTDRHTHTWARDPEIDMSYCSRCNVVDMNPQTPPGESRAIVFGHRFRPVHALTGDTLHQCDSCGLRTLALEHVVEPCSQASTSKVAVQRPQIIGLTGRMRSGKTHIAKLLAEEGYQDVAFADPLKDAVCAIFRLSREEVDRLKVARERPLPGAADMRTILQTLGTEWGRKMVSDTLWVDLMRQQLQQGGPYVVSDIRFENEAALVREMGGVVVHVRRHDPSAPAEPASHASEAGVQLAPADKVLENDVSGERLKARVLDLVMP